MKTNQRTAFFIFTGIVLALLAPAGAQVRTEIRISGRVLDAETSEALGGALVQIEGPTLVNQENNKIGRRNVPASGYGFSVPPGEYDLWAQRPGYKEVRMPLKVEPGPALQIDLRLPRTIESYAYRVEDVALPPQMIPEVSGVAFTPGGRLVAVNRRGEVWIREADEKTWSRFAYGLYEPFGVVADSESEIHVLQRPELTRLRDTDGDGIADSFETISDDWGITGNYHEFSYGLARDSKGNFYGGLGMVSAGEFPWTRGEVNSDRVIPWVGPGRMEPHRSVVPYQGWTFQITSEGKFVPWATGFRQPLGVSVSPNDEVFITDVSGAWIPTSILLHAEKGGFYGHPDGLKWHPDFKDTQVTVEMVREMRTPPALYIPRGPMGSSPGQPVWDTTDGKFGPFSGQMFFGDWVNLVMRIDLENVAGAWQGAAFPFLRNQGGLRVGNMRNAFGPDGSLYVGQTVRGWTSGEEGIQRIVWTGENPVEILTMRLTERGFALTFTEAMDPRAYADPKTYRVKRFQYNYHILDGSLRMNEVEVPIAEVKPTGDGRSVELALLELQPGYVYELQVDPSLKSRRGLRLLNPSAYYTANRLLSGQTQTGPSVLAAAPPPAQDGPIDLAAGGVTFRQYCQVCHQADGRGSVHVGTPDMTTSSGPLGQPAEALIRSVTEGKGEIMPAFGNVLAAQEIRNVVAFLRESFGGR